MEALRGLLGLFVLISLSYIIYRIMVLLKKQKNAMLVAYVLIFIFIISWPAYGFYTMKFKKVLKENCQKVSFSPSDSSVDMFLNYVKQWGFYNHPEQWNQVRGVWFIVNESSNVSTVKKKELRDYLIINGLKLHNSEKQIIDNYKV